MTAPSFSAGHVVRILGSIVGWALMTWTNFFLGLYAGCALLPRWQ